jgi:hypothetical protein
LEELLAPPKYPSADTLAPLQRDKLVTNMVTYLHKHKADEIAALEPDYAMGGSLAIPAIGIVAWAEQELEEAFQYMLRFTEMEWILCSEFFYSVSPNDLMFVAFNRSPPPGLSYTYDFNRIPNVGTLTRQLGLKAVFKIMGMMAKGLWGRDYTHRKVGI